MYTVAPEFSGSDACAPTFRGRRFCNINAELRGMTFTPSSTRNCPQTLRRIYSSNLANLLHPLAIRPLDLSCARHETAKWVYLRDGG